MCIIPHSPLLRSSKGTSKDLPGIECVPRDRTLRANTGEIPGKLLCLVCRKALVCLHHEKLLACSALQRWGPGPVTCHLCSLASYIAFLCLSFPI